ncbi:hypothetical protein HHI36_005258 [Cryptolaemus montrouzieri]|uniref:Uncharacterized protein n=1 Tax=Cryptolaemus montrouzieri TaxID=559131 RepID=A0ABD2NTQ0_9CUCU
MRKLNSIDNKYDILLAKFDALSAQNSVLRTELNEILLNVNESTQHNLDERIAHDTEKFPEILMPTGITKDDIVKVIRIGEKGSKPRPTKIILSSADLSRKILRDKKAVLGASDSKISIFEDRTEMQRSQYNRVREQLEVRKNSGEKNL